MIMSWRLLRGAHPCLVRRLVSATSIGGSPSSCADHRWNATAQAILCGLKHFAHRDAPVGARVYH